MPAARDLVEDLAQPVDRLADAGQVRHRLEAEVLLDPLRDLDRALARRARRRRRSPTRSRARPSAAPRAPPRGCCCPSSVFGGKNSNEKHRPAWSRGSGRCACRGMVEAGRRTGPACRPRSRVRAAPREGPASRYSSSCSEKFLVVRLPYLRGAELLFRAHRFVSAQGPSETPGRKLDERPASPGRLVSDFAAAQSPKSKSLGGFCSNQSGRARESPPGTRASPRARPRSAARAPPPTRRADPRAAPRPRGRRAAARARRRPGMGAVRLERLLGQHLVGVEQVRRRTRRAPTGPPRPRSWLLGGGRALGLELGRRVGRQLAAAGWPGAVGPAAAEGLGLLLLELLLGCALAALQVEVLTDRVIECSHRP